MFSQLDASNPLHFIVQFEMYCKTSIDNFMSKTRIRCGLFQFRPIFSSVCSVLSEIDKIIEIGYRKWLERTQFQSIRKRKGARDRGKHKCVALHSIKKKPNQT